MTGVKVVFRALAAILVLLGGASLYLYLAKDAGTPLSGIASIITAVAMISLDNNVAAKMAEKE